MDYIGIVQFSTESGKAPIVKWFYTQEETEDWLAHQRNLTGNFARYTIAKCLFTIEG